MLQWISTRATQESGGQLHVDVAAAVGPLTAVDLQVFEPRAFTAALGNVVSCAACAVSKVDVERGREGDGVAADRGDLHGLGHGTTRAREPALAVRIAVARLEGLAA